MLETLFRVVTGKTPAQVEAKQAGQTVEPPRVARPALANLRLERIKAQAETEAALAEYQKLSDEIGVVPPDLGIENFKALLVRLDYPIFSLAEVVDYMDAKAAKESDQKAGWRWAPLRKKDNLKGVKWGVEGRAEWGDGSRTVRKVIMAASDYYGGLQEVHNGSEVYLRGGSSPYHRTVPIHALRRIAAIEREYHDPVAFFVSEYAPMPEIRNPDPFLMAVIPNPHLDKGDGRFVIDFWEEPGFGIEQMLK